MERNKMLAAGGVSLLLLVAVIGPAVMFQIGPNSQSEDVADVEGYPVGPEKPTPLNGSNVVNYTAAYEQRLFYNDLLASQDHRLDTDERVVTDCTATSSSAVTAEEFRTQLECRGGVTDTSHLSEEESFAYSVSYRVTEETTQQIELRNYPFETNRGFDEGESNSAIAKGIVLRNQSVFDAWNVRLRSTIRT